MFLNQYFILFLSPYFYFSDFKNIWQTIYLFGKHFKKNV